MMKKVTIIIYLILSFTIAHSQTLNETISAMSNEVGLNYGESALNSFAANFNSAWLNRMPEAEMVGFDFRVGFYGIMSPINAGPDEFKMTGSFYLTRDQATEIVKQEINNSEYHQQIIDQLITKKFNLIIDGTSITSSVGDNFFVTVEAEEDLIFEVNDDQLPFPVYAQVNADEVYSFDVGNYLAAFDYLPHGTVQFNVGTLAGTEAMIRFIPSVNTQEENIGNVGMYGLGLLHNPQAYIDTELPIDFSVG